MKIEGKQQTNQDVDLIYIWKGLLQILNKIGLFLVRFVQFILKNILLISIIILLGIGIGYLMDYLLKDNYKQEIILCANFDSNSYLYDKIESRKVQRDSIIVDIDLVPIIDVFDLLASDDNRLEIGEFLSENNINISEYKEGNLTENIYKFHKLTLVTNRVDTDGSIVDNYLASLNKVPYYNKRQKIELDELENMIKEKQISIAKINLLLDKLAAQDNSEEINLNIKIFPELQGLIGSKNALLSDIRRIKVLESEMEKTFYDIAIIRNVKVKRTSFMIVVPLVLVFLYFILEFIRNRYNRFNTKSI